VTAIERGRFPDLFLAYLSVSCHHCAQPSCVGACPVNAISKREEDGIVLVDRERCIGKDSCGGACLEACPYDAPQFDVEDDAKMEKCNFCIDRLAENKQPICVAGCPVRALDSGPMDELKAKYGDVKEVQGFIYAVGLDPSIIFKAKKN